MRASSIYCGCGMRFTSTRISKWCMYASIWRRIWPISCLPNCQNLRAGRKTCSAVNEQRARRKQQRGRCDDHAKPEELPETDCFALAPDGDKPKNCSERSGDRKIGTEIYADNQGVPQQRRHVIL